MFGIGTTELLIIMLVALIVLGPKQLPGIARSLGKALGEFRRVTTDVQRTLNLEAAKIEEDEREQKKAAAVAKKAEEPQPAAKPEPSSPPPSAAGEESIPPPEHADSNPYVAARDETSPDASQPQPKASHDPPQESTVSTQDASSSVARDASAEELQKETSDPSESSHSRAQA
ncbi:Sec-independent protein translocase protein TatB [Desulfonatronum thiodismutans]|uniref:Sec-independent protein translocase protein TatB n=1 Tax=Desulfonatronum thiodismutans TaxID=159290 RepID=UPI0009FD6D82|nr:Sec-independent protein translocase protein TatB [Desulfonatronum thiodismutans]